MWRSLALGERAFHDVREVRDDTKDVCFTELVQALGFGR